MISGLELTYPWALAALPLLLLLPRQRGWALRVLGLALLTLALSGPTVSRPGGRLALLIDVSHSVGDNALAASEELSGQWRDQAQTYHFAGDVVRPAGREAGDLPELDQGTTDIARALQVAAAAGAERILLLSDGGESRGSALLALPRVPVDSYRVEPEPNARVTGLIAPQRAAAGETVEAVAVVQSDRASRARLLLSDDGDATRTIELELPAGQTVVPFEVQVPAEKSLRLSARLEVDYEQSRADDARSTEISVSTEEPVLIIGDPAIARLLRAQQIEVVEGEPDDVHSPLPYSAVVLRRSAADFTVGQLEELRSFVENGGGLLMTGGPDSFGFGAWYRTPVEDVLPVDTDLRTEVEIPLVALVIVLDRSQSMASGNPSKIELAKEGAVGVVELAYQDDLLGMVVFSDQHEWTFRLRPATERGKREMLSAILSLGTAGGTILEPAYRDALAALRTSEAALKHVIILSDGKLYDGQGPFGQGSTPDFSALAAAAAAEGITTSAIAIGRSADFEVMRQIAMAGEGRYHSALDVTTLPRIFAGEALSATRSLLRDEPTSPVARAHPLSAYEGQLPAIEAYIATAPKPTAEVLLQGQQEEPVLAVRRHGLGRTAAFTSDLNGWSGDLGAGPELPTLLGSVVRWLRTQPESYSAALSRDGNELRIVVDAIDNGEYINGAQLQARLAGRSVDLEQVAPGRYEGRLEGDVNEGTVLVVEGNQVVARAPVETPAAEFDTSSGARLLVDISSRSGGETLVSLNGYDPSLERQGQPLWPELALIALALFLTELSLRRFGTDRSAKRPSTTAR